MRIEQVPGSFFSSILNRLSPNSIYNISIRAATDFGELGIPAFKIISLQGKDSELLDRIPVEKEDLKEDVEQHKVTGAKEENEKMKSKYQLEKEQMEEKRKFDRMKECERKRLQAKYNRLNEESKGCGHRKYEHADRATEQQQQYYELTQQLERERMELQQRWEKEREQWQKEREQWKKEREQWKKEREHEQWKKEREREQWEKERERDDHLDYQYRQQKENAERRWSSLERLEQDKQLDQIQVSPERNDERGERT